MFPSESLANASVRKDSVMGIRIMSHREVGYDFSLLVTSSFLSIHEAFTKRRSCYYCWLHNVVSADAVYNTCAVILLGKGER